jgi:hypothetical protein
MSHVKEKLKNSSTLLFLGKNALCLEDEIEKMHRFYDKTYAFYMRVPQHSCNRPRTRVKQDRQTPLWEVIREQVLSGLANTKAKGKPLDHPSAKSSRVEKAFAFR